MSEPQPPCRGRRVVGGAGRRLISARWLPRWTMFAEHDRYLQDADRELRFPSAPSARAADLDVGCGNGKVAWPCEPRQ